MWRLFRVAAKSAALLCGKVWYSSLIVLTCFRLSADFTLF